MDCAPSYEFSDNASKQTTAPMPPRRRASAWLSGRKMATRPLQSRAQTEPQEKWLDPRAKKQGATGITTVAPYVAGQWGRGDNRLPE